MDKVAARLVTTRSDSDCLTNDVIIKTHKVSNYSDLNPVYFLQSPNVFTVIW